MIIAVDTSTCTQRVELNNQTVHRLGEILHDGNTSQTEVNNLATHFIIETLKFTLIHMEFCCSMQICQSDVNFAIEQFAKQYLRANRGAGAPYYHLHADAVDDKGDDDDDDYSLGPINGDENEEDEQEMVDIGQDESDDEHSIEFDDDDDEEMNFPKKPHFYPTNLFDYTFPELAENDDEFFQLSEEKFSCLVQDLLSSRFKVGLDLHDRQAGRILRNAMIRYICAECNKKALRRDMQM
mmetsp:Transcript_10089/g.12741  ORF Transcript_10089/g.12741 Transcript_10089/m.12741 type:complete len:239 (-) Transcript_10089:284-1000(-)